MLTTGGTHLEPDVVRGREVRLEADGVVHRLLPGLDRGGYLGGGSRIVHRVVGVGVLSRHLLLPSVGWTHEGGAYVFFPKRRARPPRLLYARGLPVLVTLSMRRVRTMSAASQDAASVPVDACRARAGSSQHNVFFHWVCKLSSPC